MFHSVFILQAPDLASVPATNTWKKLEIWESWCWAQTEPWITHLAAVRIISDRRGECSVLDPSMQDGYAWSSSQNSDQNQEQESFVKHVKGREAGGGADQNVFQNADQKCMEEVAIWAPPQKGVFSTWKFTHLQWH